MPQGFDVDDTTSDFDEGVANSTTSLSSSIYEASNDDKQNESLDIVHHVHLLMLDNQLFKAPLTDVQKVLDVGTGTGIWATDVGDNYPSAEVIGIDISPIQPFWVPPNVTFQIDDCKLEWTFQDDSFDLIHIRWMFGSIADWNALFQQAYRCLKPGGWLESHEASTQFRSDDGTVEDESAMSQFSEALVQGGKKMGQSMTVVEDGTQRKAMEAAQFMNIREQDYKARKHSWEILLWN
ncbi:hypothetical protein D7B24_002530 [Verticillium nonalfalfae]|uniref:Methyltransferase domain-containing protein n=1 Tax=Verticillium nonalfalfae TaxID=1051616 RepID=A0A3M9XXP3_9PEZI|nr:uncharacterized protein D7B24_002530 [Verticillium nonalfalfae]RNJ53023.1 hypothetical protein D7B24_002530 [Verticillium nonalfalfae]